MQHINTTVSTTVESSPDFAAKLFNILAKLPKDIVSCVAEARDEQKITKQEFGINADITVEGNVLKVSTPLLRIAIPATRPNDICIDYSKTYNCGIITLECYIHSKGSQARSYIFDISDFSVIKDEIEQLLTE